jgi:hypothetical protein
MPHYFDLLHIKIKGYRAGAGDLNSHGRRNEGRQAREVFQRFVQFIQSNIINDRSGF